MIVRLDIDRARQPPTLSRWVALLDRAGKRLRWVSYTRSPSGKGWHVEMLVSPRPKTRMEVVALQAVLGSDPAREAYNIVRAGLADTKQVPAYWRQRWNVLYGG